ncbi:MAG: indole-3-glycerol phosphate synthase TrpC [Bacteroidetes bacterium]|nr:indole-3-glycerol phosphate synthase TrpC [Bacteroidota bacterium]MBS1757749.1 indole-3-glycerol phosphate synthase TrpC [Bacteroidota bacterium]
MNVLNKIVAYKKEEVAVRKSLTTIDELKDSEYFSRKPLSLSKSLQLQDASGIISEFKRKSPSKGFIHAEANALEITKAYTANGASALSVLTDHYFFGGSTEDLLQARVNHLPILRKDFIIDPYQIYESKAMGADVILLIAACLTVHEVQELAALGNELKLEVLLELHGENELNHLCHGIDLIGINNRNLKTFSVDINRSIALSKMLPAGKIKIAESGIDAAATVLELKKAGYSGFLMGEAFMKHQDPGQALKNFVKELKFTI